ncbi:MAG: class I adenylate-forming enzyme family protein [Geminicoccaceae bacterium]
MLLGDVLRTAADRAPDQRALVFGATALTYRELDQQSDRIAGSLRRAGVGHGDRVALFFGNRPELVLGYFACFKLGAIAVPLNDHYKGPELAYAVGHAGVRALVAEARLFPEVVRVRPQLGSVQACYLVGDGEFPGVLPFRQLLEGSGGRAPAVAIRERDPAVIMYTSGTTARPKGVTHTHRSLWHTTLNQVATREITSDEVSLISLSVCHVAGFAGQVLTTVQVGGTMVLLPAFEPGALLNAMETHRANTLQLLPAQLWDLVEHARAADCDFGSLRCCIAGGDRVPPELQERFGALSGLEVTETCGMTESYSYAMNPPHGAKRIGSIGLPVHATRLRVIDQTGADLARGAIGEILVRSDATMAGYWDDPEHTAKTLQDGWLHTGDLGRVDDDGYYWFEGRSKEMIIRGGANISPLEVEEVLYQHPAVGVACVVGVPDRRLGEIVRAYVALRHDAAPGVTADELKQFVAHHIAAYKVPERIAILAELPLNAVGKVDRHALQARASADLGR